MLWGKCEVNQDEIRHLIFDIWQSGADDWVKVPVTMNICKFHGSDCATKTTQLTLQGVQLNLAVSDRNLGRAP